MLIKYKAKLSASLAARQHAECFNSNHSDDLTDLPTKHFSKAQPLIQLYPQTYVKCFGVKVYLVRQHAADMTCKCSVYQILLGKYSSNQDHSKVFTTGQARFIPKYYVIVWQTISFSVIILLVCLLLCVVLSVSNLQITLALCL